VILSDKLKIPPWPKLPAGRKTTVACDQMLAVFAPAKEQPGDDQAALGGPRLGPLQVFDANGDKNDVNLTDGPRQVLCRRIMYQRQEDIAIIWGSLPGEPVKDAVLYHDDKRRRTLQTFKSPQLIWHRRDNRVETKGIEAHGGT